jgi:hypothetical protein
MRRHRSKNKKAEDKGRRERRMKRISFWVVLKGARVFDSDRFSQNLVTVT